MATTSPSWQEKAKAKRESVNSLIPEEWRLKSPVPSAEQQRDVTGKFTWQYLSQREVEITETDAVDIVKYTTAGEWSAEEVTKEFCHRAALAHQFVSRSSIEKLQARATEHSCRPTAFTKFFSMQQLKMPRLWTNTSNSMALKDPFMVFLLV